MMNMQKTALVLIAMFATCIEPALAQFRDESKNMVLDFRATTEHIKKAKVDSNQQKLQTLEVMGLGLVVEMYRQSKIWTEMKKFPESSMLPKDPSKYYTNLTERYLAQDERDANALEWVAGKFVEHWPIPGLAIWPSKQVPDTPEIIQSKKEFGDGHVEFLDGKLRPAGMHHHQIASLGAWMQDDVEEILERAFLFFEQNPEVPALLLYVSDGNNERRAFGHKGHDKHVMEGQARLPDAMPQTRVALLLGRRERINAMRPFVYTPPPPKLPEGVLYQATPYRHPKNIPVPAGFKPSKWFPHPWTARQMQQFDDMKTLAILHRPQRVSFRKDAQGKPVWDKEQKHQLMSAKEQQAVFQQGMALALQQTPGGKPARVFYDAGGPSQGKQIVPLSMAMHQLLPDADLFNPKYGFDISRRVGNTGTASPFVQWALATMSGWIEGGSALTVNLRQKDEATITVVSPAPNRKVTHEHPFDVLRAAFDGATEGNQGSALAHLSDEQEAQQLYAFMNGLSVPVFQFAIDEHGQAQLLPEAGTAAPASASSSSLIPPDWDPDATLPPGLQRKH